MHTAIIGATTSGKTFLARQLAKKYKLSSGYDIFALHKPREPWKKDEVTIQTSDVELFLEKIEERNAENEEKHLQGFTDLKGYITFMELSDASANKYDERIRSLYKAGRHDGHKNHYLSQRATSVHPDIRENCNDLYLLQCYTSSAKEWAEEFCDDELKKASKLPVHLFYYKKRGSVPAKLHKLTF